MATILEGLNQIAQAVGGTGEAESNLEALNAISGALGGSADATENAEAIANIAENASGGGGDFTIAKVVVKAGDGVTLPVPMPMATVVHADSASGAPNTILARLYYIAKGQTVEFETPLYKGLYICAVESTSSSGPTITGAAEYNAEQQMLTITGDCTIEW